jgi:hypothetical protein
VGTGPTDGPVETAGYGDSVVRLSANVLTVKASYTHPNAFPDSDFGFTPTIFQTPGCSAMTVAGNKDGTLVELQRDAISSGPVQLYDASAGVGSYIGAVAFSPATNLIYNGTYTASGSNFQAGLAALSANGNCTLKQQWYTPTNTISADFVFVLAPPTVANGVVYWANGYNGQVFAFDATTGAQLWSSGSTIQGATFAAPVVDGHLFVSAWDHNLYAFGV